MIKVQAHVALRTSRIKRKRGPGRPPAKVAGTMAKADIVHRALQLCRQESLQSVSIVRVANEMGVTPALIHYYLGGRDRLTSGVMNAFYAALVIELRPATADWRADLTAVFGTIYDFYIRYSGIAAYLMSHNRFRLFQLIESGERDFGALFFDRVIGSVRIAGLSAESTAMYAHLLLQHVLSSAYQQAARQLPEDHQDFLVSRLQKLQPSEAPNIFFVLESFAALRGNDAFRAGLNIVADAMGVERQSQHAAAAAGAGSGAVKKVRSRKNS
jgi:AcrR family transcriptional regulator